MKKILSLLFILICSYTFAQPVVNRAGAANTVSDARLQSQYNLFVPRYQDTVSANLQRGIDSCGALIYTYDYNGYWYRQCSPKKWVQMIGLSPSPTRDTLVWSLGGNTVGLRQATPILGTLDAYDLNLVTNGVARIVIPQDGVLRSSSARNKYLTYDTLNKQLYYGDGGTGSSYTFNQGLTESGGTVKLGGTISESSQILGTGGGSLYIDSLIYFIAGAKTWPDRTALLSYSNNAAIQYRNQNNIHNEIGLTTSLSYIRSGLATTDYSFFKTQRTDSSARIMSISKKVFIDSINTVSSTTGRKVLVHDTATGKIERIDPSNLELNYADSLRRSGLSVQMRKNGNWTTQFNLPDSAGSGWGVNGNTGLTKNNFIGHTDSVPLIMKTNGHRMFFISDTWDSTAYSEGRGEAQDILIGNNAGGVRTDSIKGRIAIGDSAMSSFSFASKWAWDGNLSIGNHNLRYGTTIYGTTSIGHYGLLYTTTGYRNTSVGQNTGRNNITGAFGTYLGWAAGEWATSKSNQTFTGNQSGRAGGGEFDSFYGSVSGYLSTGSITGVTITNGGSGYTSATVTFSSPLNVPPGYNLSETATGTAIIDGGVITGVTMTNIGRGYNSAHTHTVTITGDGSSATATPIMDYSGYNTSTGGYSFYNNYIGKYNVNDGYYSGYYGTRDTGTTNIGAYSGKLSSISSIIKNATAIGYNAKTSQSNTIILGDTTVKTMIGVGTTQPTAMIDIRTTSDDAIRLDMPSKGAGKMLVSDANGNASWQTQATDSNYTTIATFTAGGGFASDTTMCTDSTLFGSFYTGQFDYTIASIQAVIKGNAGDSIVLKLVYNDTFNVDGTKVNGAGLSVNNRYTGNTFTISTNRTVPANTWLWMKPEAVITGKKPKYISVTLVGYKTYVAP